MQLTEMILFLAGLSVGVVFTFILARHWHNQEKSLIIAKVADTQQQLILEKNHIISLAAMADGLLESQRKQKELFSRVQTEENHLEKSLAQKLAIVQENVLQTTENVNSLLSDLKEANEQLSTALSTIEDYRKEESTPFLSRLSNYLDSKYPKIEESQALEIVERKAKEVIEVLHNDKIPERFWEFYKEILFYPVHREKDPNFGLQEIQNVTVTRETNEGNGRKETIVSFSWKGSSFKYKYSEHDCTMPDGILVNFAELFLYDSNSNTLTAMKNSKWNDYDRNAWGSPEWGVPEAIEFHSGRWLSEFLEYFLLLSAERTNQMAKYKEEEKEKKMNKLKRAFDL